MLKKNIWIPLLSVLVIAMGCGLFYGQKVANQEPVKVYKPVDVSKPATPKPPPPGETAESGHWHGEEWHAEPHDTHAPAEVSEVDAELATPPAERTQVQSALRGVLPIDAQLIEQAMRNGDVKLFDDRTQEYHTAVKAWQDWHKKSDELHENYMQAGQEVEDALPATEAEQERYDTDENYKREVDRKAREALDKNFEIGAMVRAHEAKRPPVPYIP